MSETDTTSGGATVTDSSADVTEDSQTETQTEKTVKFDDHKRALDDMHKFKKQVHELKNQMGSLESERLREKEDYKTLSEKQAKELEEKETKLKSLEDSWFYNERFKAVLSSAQKAGIRDEALDDLSLLDLSNDVRVERTDAGRVMVNGHDDYVQSLKKQRPHWFKTGNVPAFNPGGANSEQKQAEVLTAQRFVELERKYVSNPAKLKELYKQYSDQKRKAAG